MTDCRLLELAQALSTCNFLMICHLSTLSISPNTSTSKTLRSKLARAFKLVELTANDSTGNKHPALDAHL